MSTKEIVLITGGNRGIGYGVARKLSREYSNFHVIIGSRDANQGREAVSSLLAEEGLSGSSISSVELDVTSDESISAAKKTIEEQHGRLDVLINNAGIALDVKEKGKLPLRTIMQRTYDVNVIGAALVTEIFVPLLEKSANPRIVFVSSEIGSLTSAADPSTPWFKDPFLAYKSSKSSLNMVMLWYNALLAEKGFKVNAACPGYVATNLNSFHGTGTVEDGAVNIVRLAVLGKDGETGTFSAKEAVSRRLIDISNLAVPFNSSKSLCRCRPMTGMPHFTIHSILIAFVDIILSEGS
ncbi:short-chain dehydrogenase, putative [Talaromyces stipitatus ATCC 10500]|uniref:Short-chain dehydrogenase, putative n=1 Tax=Talaromyces stipitatus (strain ATCC 10500 / CBS 375.48 / QM 6759 / NRRL 1006) TaxID=441959 RepID=B8MCY7_TALSN|nr:short-chain dehydrogenase, putative [Talaromyces stipitatus ATCC 10500]EED17513.1 short-chain dehydrogenase, putative [Talaromyces stipitatus ATCC 10500]